MNSKQFKALQAKWYKKLKKEGFEDIEQADGNLKSWDSRRFQRRPQQVLSTQEYYYQANQLLETHLFETSLHKSIWQMHVEGVGIKDIAKKLKIGKDTVGKVINSLKGLLRGDN